MPSRALTPAVRSGLFDLLVVAGVAGLTGFGIFNRVTPPATMAIGFGMAVAVAFRRRWPLAVMAAVGSGGLLQVLLFPPKDDPLPYDLAVLVAMYSTVKYGRHVRDGYLAAAVVATGIVIEVSRHSDRSWWALALFFVGVCGGVWLMASSMRTRRIYVAGLEERAATLEREREHLARIAVADERATIARELHDVVAHSLAVMIVQADGGSYAFDTDPAQARAALATVAATGRDALEDMRRMVSVLRSDADGAPERAADDRRRITLDQVDALVDRARSAWLQVQVRSTGTPAPLAPTVELAAYRIVQEALTNVLRHAGPRARVRLDLGHAPRQLRIQVADDGGDRPVATAGSGGHGLVGMRERVAVYGGRFEAGPVPGGGWTVTAVLPVPTLPTGEPVPPGDPVRPVATVPRVATGPAVAVPVGPMSLTAPEPAAEVVG